MKRRVWGIILGCIGVLGTLGNATDRRATLDVSVVVAGIVFAAGGFFLFWFGQQAVDRHEAIINAALRQFRDSKRILSSKIANEANASVGEVMDALRREARTGVLPANLVIDPLPASISSEKSKEATA